MYNMLLWQWGARPPEYARDPVLKFGLTNFEKSSIYGQKRQTKKQYGGK